ncbi:glycosyltransferase family 4 protein [Halorussus limi]|uniref:Glycosyltransferase family 4 protein n=1 Tax=Halorussus limi TaxID=2938695 RepID=A0A8U0HWE6_9EURY|nr:glycosyltransferase family 4 protein [Halorussus limi]UPV75247.1 glycosyltransferase family 4 protein [Halorussus limi]
MKILYYGSSTQIHSGASQWMFRLAKGIRERGRHHTIAILPGDEGIMEWYDKTGIETIIHWTEPLRLRRSLLGHIGFLLYSLIATVTLTIHIYREDVDIVHVNEIKYPHGLIAGKLAGAKTVCHVRAHVDSWWLRWFLARFTALCSDRIICVSKRTQERLFHDVGIESKNIQVVHDGVPSPERFRNPPNDDEFYNRLGIDPESFVVLQVSKLAQTKGHDRLLDVADYLEEYDDIEFCLMGGRVDGHEEYADSLETAAVKQERVHLTGFYPDVVEALIAADVVVHLPRHEDPFPGVVLEGMLAAKPVVGSRSGGIPEQITHGETGFIVPKKNAPDEIAERLTELYENESLCSQMGVTGREHALERFPVEGHFNEIEEVYTSL